jgi:hypothetical protein
MIVSILLFGLGINELVLALIWNLRQQLSRFLKGSLAF